jgi:hypothetical protein
VTQSSGQARASRVTLEGLIGSGSYPNIYGLQLFAKRAGHLSLNHLVVDLFATKHETGSFGCWRRHSGSWRR